jgi:hypothetical protein
MFDNPKNTVLSGKYILTTSPTWLPNTKRIIRVCNAIDKNNNTKVTIIFLDTKQNDLREVFIHLARQDNQLQVIQGGSDIIGTESIHYLVLKETSDSNILRLENRLNDYHSQNQPQQIDLPKDIAYKEEQVVKKTDAKPQPKFRWGFFAIGGIGLLVLISALILSVIPPLNPTPTATTTPSPTTTVPTITPTVTYTTTPTLTVTPAPTSMLNSQAGHVIRSEHFNNMSNLSFSMYGVGTSELIDGHLVLTESFSSNPTTDGEAAGRSNFSPQPGDVSIFLFKTEKNTYFGYHYELYENTDTGQQYTGINLQQQGYGLNLNFWKGNSGNQTLLLSYPVTQFQYETWYYYSLQVKPDGSVVAKIWERDQPTNVILDQTVQLDPAWAKPEFTFVVTVYQGKMEIDEYQEVALTTP